MRRTVKGEELIILEEDGMGGYVSIAAAKLTMKMREVFSEAALAALVGKGPAGLREMTFIDFIRDDIAGDDVMGWRQHQKALKEEKLI